MISTQSNTSVVAFVAHPDAAGLFCAGTLALLADKGWKVTLCSMTGTAAEGDPGQTMASTLGIGYTCLGGSYGLLLDSVELRLRAATLICQKKAGILLTHLPGDFHIDHRACCSIVDAAAMLATLRDSPLSEPALDKAPVLYHSSAFGLNDVLGSALAPPHFYIDISAAMDRKERLRSIRGMEDPSGEFRKQDRFWGKSADCEFAEPWWQHQGAAYPSHGWLQDALSELIKTPLSEVADREP